MNKTNKTISTSSHLYVIIWFFVTVLLFMSLFHISHAQSTNKNTEFEIPENYTTIIKIGGTSKYQNIEDALRAIPDNAGDVIFYFNGWQVIDSSIQLPTDKGITSFTFDSESKTTIYCEEGKFFAWGIPLIVNKNVTLSQLSIYGGGYAINGQDVLVSESIIVVYGTVGSIYGGGYALDRSQSGVRAANIALYGAVQNDIYGGGYAVGNNSYSYVDKATIYIDDRAEVNRNVYYGGYAASRCIDIDPTTRFKNFREGFEVIEQDCGREGGMVSVKMVYPDIRGRVKGSIISQNKVMAGARGKSISAASKSITIENPIGHKEAYDVEKVQNMVLAPGQACDTLLCAMEKIDKNTTELNIILTHSAIEDYSITIPYSGYSLNKVTIDADYPVKISFGNRNFFANGIDFTLGKNVTFTDVRLFAGTSSLVGKSEFIMDSSVTIEGTVDEIYGGSLVNNDGSSASVHSSSILITGSVLKNVYGGGFAYGKKAESTVDKVMITLADSGIIRGNLVYGGYAQSVCLTDAKGNQDCNHGGYTYTGSVSAAIYGKVVGNIIPAGMDTEGAHSDFGEVTYVMADDPSLMNITYPQIIRVGQYEEIKTLQKAFQSIRYPGKEVQIILSSNLEINESVEIPTWLEIESIVFDSDRPGVNRSINLMGKDFYANGIPLTIGENVVLINSCLYGGSYASFGNVSYLEKADLSVYGYVDTIYLGGKAQGIFGEAVSSVMIDDARLTLGGTVKKSLYAGGNAINGGYSGINNAQIDILDTGKVYITLYAYGQAASIVNQQLDESTLRCFGSLSECEKYASRGACESGYSHGVFHGTGIYTMDHGRFVQYGYWGSDQYCVQLSQNVTNNKSLSEVGSVYLNIDGIVQGQINCGGKTESDGGAAIVDNIEPADLCTIW